MTVEIRDQAKAAEIDILKENSDFNFSKIYFLKHLLEYISGYGYLGQYTTEISERAHKKQIQEGWRRSNHVDAMVQILKQGNNYRSIMEIKAEMELRTLNHEPEWLREHPRFCGKREKKYKDVVSLSMQIEVLQLQAFLIRYLNLHSGAVYFYRIGVWKSLEIKIELIPWQEYQAVTLQKIQ